MEGIGESVQAIEQDNVYNRLTTERIELYFALEGQSVLKQCEL